MNRKLLQSLAVATFSTIFMSGNLVAMSSDEIHNCQVACLTASDTCEGNCPEPSYSAESKAAHTKCVQACDTVKASCVANCK
jgi:hypothetical protein